MELTIRQVLTQYAAQELGEDIFAISPVRVSSTDNGNISFVDTNGNGLQTWAISWGLGALPTQQEIDAFVANSGPIVVEDDTDETDPALIEPRVTVLEGIVNVLQTAVSALQTNVANILPTLTRLIQLVPDVPVTAFPANPEPFRTVRRLDLGLSTWTWVADAGTAGEWWGRPWTEGFGAGAVSNNQYSRSYNGNVMSSTRGIPAHRRYRVLGFSSIWTNNRSGSWQIRQNGIPAGRVISVTNNDFIQSEPPTDTDIWLIGSLTATTKQVIGVYWGGATGTVSAHRGHLDFMEVRYEGE